MKWIFLFLFFFFSFSLVSAAGNEDGLNNSGEANFSEEINETEIFENVSLFNETFELNLTNVTLSPIRDDLASPNETPLDRGNQTGQANETLIMQILDFVISSFIEGSLYSFDFFEFLLDSFVMQGSEYSAEAFTDMMFTPNAQGSGSVYSLTAGSYGLLSTPYVTPSYCGDSTCDDDEDCSSCSSDCGSCVVEESGGGGGGGGGGVVGNVSVEGLPEQLFDITFNLEDISISGVGELFGIVTFESFGTVPTLVNLTFIILNEAGNEIYREEGSITVTTEEVLRWNYETLGELPDGKYTAVLNTLYNVDVFDEFRQEFEIGSGTRGITGKTIDFIEDFERGGLVEIIIEILVLIGIIYLIIRLLKKRKRLGKKKIVKKKKQEFKSKVSDILEEGGVK